MHMKGFLIFVRSYEQTLVPLSLAPPSVGDRRPARLAAFARVRVCVCVCVCVRACVRVRARFVGRHHAHQ